MAEQTCSVETCYVTQMQYTENWKDWSGFVLCGLECHCYEILMVCDEAVQQSASFRGNQTVFFQLSLILLYLVPVRLLVASCHSDL